MKTLLISAKDWDKRGGSGVKVYSEMIRALSRSGIDADFKFVTSTDALLDDITSIHPDIVFSGAYHTYNKDGTVDRNVHSLLDREGIPYVGSNEESLELVLDKTALKKKWADSDILTPWFTDIIGDYESTIEGHFPVLLKPRKEGGGRGIDEKCVISDSKNLREAIAYLTQQGFTDLFAEQFLGTHKREFTVAVIGSDNNRIIGPSEMFYTGDGNPPKVLSKELKDGDQGTRLFEPVAVPQGNYKQRLIEMADKMCSTAGVTDYARCDIIQGNDEKMYAIEINGQSVIESYFHTGMQSCGLNHDATINAMFLASIVRNRNAGHQMDIPKGLKKVIPKNVYDRIVD